MKKLTFNMKKYINSCTIKLLIFIVLCLLLYFILLLLSGGEGIISLLKLVLIILFIGIVYFVSKFYIDYKYYSKEYFDFTYDENTITYYHFRFIRFFEETIFPFSNYIRINLEANRIDRVILKHRKIYIYGLMTIETEASKLKQKIINKYKLPDYFNETEDFLKTVNKNSN